MFQENGPKQGVRDNGNIDNAGDNGIDNVKEDQDGINNHVDENGNKKVDNDCNKNVDEDCNDDKSEVS